MNLPPFLEGKSTHLVSALTVAFGVIGYLLGELDFEAATAFVLGGLGLSRLRHGFHKVENTAQKAADTAQKAADETQKIKVTLGDKAK